jgi:hypothetical protein
MFSVQPTQWYPDAINGFCGKVNPTSALAGKPIFGREGFLNARFRQMLVAFKRKITITGQSSLIAGLQDGAQQAQSHFNVGSFFFSANPTQTLVQQTTPGTIVFQDNTNAPRGSGPCHCCPRPRSREFNLAANAPMAFFPQPQEWPN